MASLPDQPRYGAPSKLSDTQRHQLKEWIDAEPLSKSGGVHAMTAKRP